jgi:type IV pilus assembly protein PilQ
VKGTLTIVLDDVPWDQALDIVLKNNDLARQLEGNVLRIATVATLRKEAEDRRAQDEAEALAVSKVTVTRFLSYAHSKDVVPTLKRFLTQRGDVISDDRTNALIISDIPSVIPGIDNLIRQLDRKTQEVEIEARVVAATRSFARDIGTQFGFGFGNAATAIGGASSVGTSPVGSFGLAPFYPVVGTTAPSPTTLAQIPLFSNLASSSPTSGITFMNRSASVQVDAIITMAESRGLLKVLSRPRVVTQNNISAVVKQGVRVPIVTQAQLGGPPTVTYVDAFLRLTVIPQITSEGTIFLNVDVENTTPDFSHSIQGNPELITQQATTQVLVTDGGTVVIGGVVQTQNSTQVSQVPVLGNIPYLGNLFKHTQVSTSNQELIFFITPRVIQT